MAQTKLKSGVRYQRTLKLAPDIGDWTKITPDSARLQSVHIRDVSDRSFDNLPESDMTYLHYFHYRLAEQLLAHLSDRLMIKVEFHSVSVEQMSAKSYMTQLPRDVMVADIGVSKLGNVHLLLDNELSAMFVSRLSGADLLMPRPDVMSEDATSRWGFTDLEIVILRTQVEEFLPIFGNLWREVFRQDQLSFDLKYGPFEPDDRSSDTDAYSVFSLRFSLANGPVYSLQFAYPNYVIKNLLAIRRELPDPVKRRVYLKTHTIEDVYVPIKVDLGETRITMGDLRNLQVGDVVTFDTSIEEPVTLHVSDQVKLFGQPGVKGRKVAVQVIGVHQEEKVPVSIPVRFDEPEVHETVDRRLNDGAIAASEPVIEASSLDFDFSELDSDVDELGESVAPELEEAVVERPVAAPADLDFDESDIEALAVEDEAVFNAIGGGDDEGVGDDLVIEDTTESGGLDFDDEAVIEAPEVGDIGVDSFEDAPLVPAASEAVVETEDVLETPDAPAAPAHDELVGELGDFGDSLDDDFGDLDDVLVDDDLGEDSGDEDDFSWDDLTD